MKTRIWYEELGFYENPFSIKPIFSSILFGYEKELKLLISSIKKGEIVTLEGDYGLGKTTIMNHLIEEFGGQKKLVYVSCNRFDKLDISDIIKNAGSLIKRLLNKKTRNIVLVLDEAQELTKKDFENIFEGYIDNFFKSIIFITPDYNLLNLTEKYDKVIRIKLYGITEQQAISLVYERLEGKEIMDKKIIKKIFNISGQNPRAFLSNCEDVCRAAFLSGAKVVKDEHLKAITA